MGAAVATQTPDLQLGTLDLMMSSPDPTYGWRIQALADNFTTGDPEAVIAAIQSQLQDGDIERIDRHGNRTATIPLQIDAPGSTAPGDAIPRAQAAIDMACPQDGSWTTLSWTSPLKGAQTTVYEVTSATVSTTKDDLGEMVQGCRYVTLTIRARPFVRPTSAVTIPAQAVVGSTTTTIDDGTSLTGWSLLTARPASATNLVTNPSFETNISGWFAGTGTASIAQDTYAPDAAVGSCALQVNPSASTWSTYCAAMPVTAGSAYFATANVNVTSGTSTTLAVQWFSDAGGSTLISTSTVASRSGGGGFIQMAGTATAPTGAVSARILVTQTDSGRIYLVVDAVALTLATWQGGYFSGATASTSAVTYAWTGTANGSTSTATFTAPTLAVVSGTVKGTVYGSDSASIRRTGAVNMSALPYMKIVGTATINGAGSANLAVAVADGGAAVSVISSSVNPTTGDFSILLNRPAGFATSVDVTATYSGPASVNDVTTVAVDAITITDNPYGTGAVQVQNISVLGSRRTDVSLLVQGLNAAGTAAVPLGNETLVYTATAGTDGRAKFGDARSLAARAGTTDSTAVSGSYDTLGTTAAPTTFQFAASKLLPGNYLVYARIKAPTAVVGDQLSFRASVTPAAGDAVYDPRNGAWKTSPGITAVAANAVWPQVNTGTWTIIPIGMLRLPPADLLQDPGAQITIYVAKGSTAVTLDDLFLCNADVGQASLVLTSYTGNSFSAVRLDAATIGSPQALCYVGAAQVGSSTPAFLADAGRWFGEQHKASPGLLQIATVTPGCSTARVSGSYYPKFHTDVAATS